MNEKMKKKKQDRDHAFENVQILEGSANTN